MLLGTIGTGHCNGLKKREKYRTDSADDSGPLRETAYGSEMQRGKSSEQRYIYIYMLYRFVMHCKV